MLFRAAGFPDTRLASDGFENCPRLVYAALLIGQAQRPKRGVPLSFGEGIAF